MDGTGSDVEEAIFQRNIDKVYGPLLERVRDVVDRSTAALVTTKECNAHFVATRSSSSSEREQVLNDLQAKYDAWRELRTNLQEGEKFYGNLKALLLKFQNKCKDFCDVRRVEKTEIMKDLAQVIINTPHEQYAAHSSAPPSSQYNPPPQGAPLSSLQQQQPPARPPLPAQVPSRPAPQPQQPAQQPPRQAQQPPYQQPPAYAPPAYPYAPAPTYASGPYGGYGAPQQQVPQYPYGGASQGGWGQPPAQPYAPPYGGYQAPPQQQPGPYSSVPQASLAPGEWACATCTFHNNALLPTCEMCGTARPRP